eukprot:COSAG01_NODE_4646_length_4853_cov_70.544594_2_plen_319_part_00
MVVEDARRRYMADPSARDVLESFGDLHGWLRSEQTLELVRAWRHSYFEQARQTLVRAERCRRSTFVQLNNNTPYTLRRATCALKYGVWLVMPPEFIVRSDPSHHPATPRARAAHCGSAAAASRCLACCRALPLGAGRPCRAEPSRALRHILRSSEETAASRSCIRADSGGSANTSRCRRHAEQVPGEQGVPFGSGFQLGPQSTSVDPQSGEQTASSFLVGTKGIVAYTVFVEEENRMVLLEVDWTNVRNGSLPLPCHFCSLSSPFLCTQVPVRSRVSSCRCGAARRLSLWETSVSGATPPRSHRSRWSARPRTRITRW